MSCDRHIMMPYNGTWVGIEEGDTSTQTIYCAKCEDVWKVERKNINTEQVGNLEELR